MGSCVTSFLTRLDDRLNDVVGAKFMKKSLEEVVAKIVIQCIGCTDGDQKFSTVCKCYVGVARLLVPWR